jgi:trans-aconitate methyltransferase
MSTLPQDVVSGESVATLPNHALEKMFKLADLGRRDVFYHLGCGKGEAVAFASKRFGVKRAVGIEINESIASKARRKVARLKNAEIVTGNICDIDLSSATVVFFWFSEPAIVDVMLKKFRKELKDGARIITIWSSPGMMLPEKVEFPFIVCKKPFKYATSIKQQIKAIYGSKCIDFTAAWLLAERYIDELGVVQNEYRRFVNMLQSMVIWINAWNMAVTCEDGVPPPVTTYIGILREFFGIDMKELFTRDPKEESSIIPDDDKMGCC